MGFEINNYNLHLLPGTEMSGEESRKEYFKKTGWRLYDNGYGIYNNKLSNSLRMSLHVKDFK